MFNINEGEWIVEALKLFEKKQNAQAHVLFRCVNRSDLRYSQPDNLSPVVVTVFSYKEPENG